MAIIKWKTQKEAEDEKLFEALKPSQDEVNDAELEIKIITLLSELEVL